GVLQRRRVGVRRIGFKCRMLERHDVLNRRGGQLRRKPADIRDRNKHGERLIALGSRQLLRASNRLPRRSIEFSASLLADDENHGMTLASSLSRCTSSLAASAGDPEIMCVFLAFSGGYIARIRLFDAAVAAGGSGDFRISFFFAAMMPLSVA